MTAQHREGLWLHSTGRACDCTAQGGLVAAQHREGLWLHSTGRACGYTAQGGLVATQHREGLWLQRECLYCYLFLLKIMSSG